MRTVGEWVDLRLAHPESASRLVFEEAWERARNEARGLGLPIADAEDVASEVLLRVLDGRARAELAPRSTELGAWVRGVARHVAMDALAARSRREEIIWPEGEDVESCLARERARRPTLLSLGASPFRYMTGMQHCAVASWAEGTSIPSIGRKLDVTRERALELVKAGLSASRRHDGWNRHSTRASYPADSEILAGSLGPRQLRLLGLLRDGWSERRIALALGREVSVVHAAAIRLRRRLGKIGAERDRQLSESEGGGGGVPPPHDQSDNRSDRPPETPAS